MTVSVPNSLITIVVPVYNVEKYLEKSVQSLLKQDHENIEILLVDDGSTDQSGAICDHYSTIDNRVRVFHKMNGGLSDARNYGIERARGSYITFIDSDDYVAPKYVSILYNSLVRYDADISVCEFSIIGPEGQEINHPSNSGKQTVLTRRQAIEIILKQKPFSNSACGKLFKTSYFQNVQFPVGRIYEDVATTYKLFLKATAVVFTEKTLYYYVYRPQSISKSSFSVNQMDCLFYAEEMVNSVLAQYPDLKSLGDCRLMDSCAKLIKSIPPESFPEEFDEVWSKLYRIRGNVLISPYASLKRRFMALLSFGGKKHFPSLMKSLNL